MPNTAGTSISANKKELLCPESSGVYRHIHPEDRRAMLGFLNNAAKGMEDKFNKEVRVLREDGSYTWTHVNLIVKPTLPNGTVSN